MARLDPTRRHHDPVYGIKLPNVNFSLDFSLKIVIFSRPIGWAGTGDFEV